MEPKKNNQAENAAANTTDNEHVIEAREEAMQDIDNDAELSAHNPNDDLDEGELARLGEEGEGVI